MIKIEVHQATVDDAEVLFGLNERFNGTSCSSPEMVRESLATNTQEAVFLVKCDGIVAGFCCVQVFKSMCYDRHYAEITELFVDEDYRRQGLGSELLQQVEEHFSKENIAGFQLFTGADNLSAQAFYKHVGYSRTKEIMYRKRRKS